MRSLSVIIFLACCTSGCAGPLTAPSDALAAGVWGGQGIRLTVTATGASFDYGCDAGMIPAPLVVDRSGKFSAAGTYSFGRGGPIEVDDPPLTAHAARYEGTTDGKIMQLTVFLPALSRKVGDFLLEIGRQPTLDRCL